MAIATGNDKVMERFGRLMANQRLAHAYMFIGPNGTGKTRTALQVAQLVNCIEPRGVIACGTCASCVKIISGNHPDVMFVPGVDEDSIKIEAIRFLLSRVQLRAFEAKVKVFILRRVETMTLEAANALLKTLEEPAANTLMILTTTVAQANLDTIRSRCHSVHFFPTSETVMTERLMAEGLVASDARFTAFMAQGCQGRAEEIVNQKLIVLRETVINDFIMSPYADAFIKEIAADNSQAAFVLNVLMAFFRDVLLVAGGANSAVLVYPDYLKTLQQFARLDVEQIYAIIAQISETKRLLDENLNIKIALTLLKERVKG